MKIYNTMTNSLEDFISLEEKNIKMYVCGPTVYNYIHLGNARPLVVFDVLARFFKYIGYTVEYIQNFTDIDDKIIKKAKEENLTTEEVAEKYIKVFFEDIDKLNILDNIVRPKVTENIAEIIEIIEKIIKNGYAYEKEGNVFFDLKKYSDYGKLSNQKIEELDIGARIEINSLKKNSLDFVLWKKQKEGEPYWESPWGRGRPGWHIECSAMAKKYLGDTFDIHGGGQDLVFPHHENEIAQSKCACGGEFARYWMHNGFVQIDGEKMSKSLGNFHLLRDILKKFEGNVLRMFILSTHYRKPINFSFENVEDTKKSLKNIINSMKRYENILEKNKDFLNNIKLDEILEGEMVSDFINKIKGLDKKFILAMEEDMNTPQALATIFDQIRETNKFYDLIFNDIDKKNIGALNISYKMLKTKIEEVLGIELTMNLNEKERDEMTKDLIELLIKIRKNARNEKNFKLSDEIRDSLKGMGIIIKDNKDGTTSYEF